MKYLLLLIAGPEDVGTEEEEQARMEEWFAYDAAVKAAGVLVGGEALHGPETATTVDARTGTVTDGPFAETKEVLGGYYLLDVADHDEAIAWAKKIPPYTSVDIRPVMTFD